MLVPQKFADTFDVKEVGKEEGRMAFGALNENRPGAKGRYSKTGTPVWASVFFRLLTKC
jgi:hypothetical protein